MYNKVEICGVNTSKLKVLSEEEKNELLIKTKEILLGFKIHIEELQEQYPKNVTITTTEV